MRWLYRWLVLLLASVCFTPELVGWDLENLYSWGRKAGKEGEVDYHTHLYGGLCYRGESELEAICELTSHI